MHRKLLLLIALLALARSAMATPFTFTTLLQYGNQAPGLPAGELIEGLSAGRINSAGRVIFDGEYKVGQSSGQGIWLQDANNVSLLFSEGSAAPGMAAGVVFAKPDSSTQALKTYNPTPGPSGQVAFQAYVKGPGITTANDLGIWSGTAGNVHMVAQVGGQAVGLSPGITYNFFDGYLVNDSGQVVLRAGLTGSGITSTNNEAIWLGAPGNLQLVAQAGSSAPNTSASTVFGNGSVAFHSPALNGSTVGFISTLSGPDVTASNGDGIWVGGVSGLNLLVRAGDPVPGVAGATFPSFIGTASGFVEPLLDNAGNAYFRAGLLGKTITNKNNYAVFAGKPGHLQIVARSGDQAPGLPTGVVFGSAVSGGVPSQLSVTPGGHLAFQTVITGTGVQFGIDNYTIWAGTKDSLHLVARSGTQPPGAAAGVTFQNDNDSPFEDEVAVNDGDEVAFHARLEGPGINSTNLYGIYAADHNGTISKILRDGDLYDVGGGHFKTISAVDFFHLNSDPTNGASPLNDNNQLALDVSFTDFTSAIVVVNLPEPSGLLIAFSGCLAVLVYRARQCRHRATSFYGRAA